MILVKCLKNAFKMLLNQWSRDLGLSGLRMLNLLHTDDFVLNHLYANLFIIKVVLSIVHALCVWSKNGLNKH